MSTEDRYADYDESNDAALQTATSSRANSFQLEEGVQSPDIQHDDEGVSEVILAWKHIDSWTYKENPDLNASLSDPCTRNDILRAEKDLGIQFPSCVKASLRIHDGQEDLGSLCGTSGIFYGLKLMSLDEIVHMTMTWRNVAEQVNRNAVTPSQRITTPQLSHPSASSVNLSKGPVSGAGKSGYGKLSETYNDPNLQRKISQNTNKHFKGHIPSQRSIPPGHIHPAYAHPGWVPLVTDDAGNHIAIDLSPAEKGKYAQVILFGRDFDTKFVIADHWGDFLLMFVSDLEKGNWYFVDEGDDLYGGEGELVFRDKENNGMPLEYFEVLRKRALAKWRKMEKRPVSRADGSLPENPETEESTETRAGSGSGPTKSPLGRKEGLEAVNKSPKEESVAEPVAEPKEEPKEKSKVEPKEAVAEPIAESKAEPVETPSDEPTAKEDAQTTETETKDKKEETEIDASAALEADDFETVAL